jgi:hypothetical protein
MGSIGEWGIGSVGEWEYRRMGVKEKRDRENGEIGKNN